ncbi:hypothetical protein Q3G72_020345 [Acer saccharum]|nr:hypothetical protein Q3G72_020345 [Acer saccharum]
MHGFGKRRKEILYVTSQFSKSCRLLDNAAIIETTPERDEQEKGGRLFSVTQVKECKMVLIWTAFPAFGLLLSTGNTFFSEQAGNNLSSPESMAYILALGRICELVSYLYDLLLRRWVPEAKWKQAKIVGICAGMVVSIFCFAFSWCIEARRLQIVEKRGLPDKPEETIPMSIFWLAPQFCLLGLMKGLVKDVFQDFMIDQLPHSWKNYVSAMNGFIIDGIGSFLSIVCIYVNRSLFSTTLNRSRLGTSTI